MKSQRPNASTRRKFLKSASIIASAPAILTAKRTAAQNVVGNGEIKYHFEHNYPQLPEPFSWQTTHNVAVDHENNLYVIHEGQAKLQDHPSIFVFNEEGKFLRAFGKQFQGGGHGIDIRMEAGTPYLYVAAYQQVKAIAKLTLSGEEVWSRRAPIMSGHYADEEATNPKRVWGRNRFMPTNFAFLPNNDFLVADGYGSYFIHRYNSDGKWISSFGGPGQGQGTFSLPHGLWIDQRIKDEPRIVVADRAHNALQVFSLAGEYLETISDFGLPANLDTFADQMLVPELVARVSIIDKDYKTIVTIGDDRDRINRDKEKSGSFTIRTDPKKWQEGKFVHPHDACFDLLGNIYVAEWVSSGRITKLSQA